MSLLTAKSNLAKLLATENIIVEQQNVQTASFDVKNRTLTLPTFATGLSPNIQDVFISHEVSHALHTSLDGLLKIKELGLNFTIVNVCEDSRIERLIKDKYPGLKAIYSRGYAELRDIDFFGLSKLDFDDMTIVDKINLTCKLGFIPEIEWSEEETALLEEVEATKTFDDVLVVSKKVQDFARDQLIEMKTINYHFYPNDDEENDDFDSGEETVLTWEEVEVELDEDNDPSTDSDNNKDEGKKDTNNIEDEGKKDTNNIEGNGPLPEEFQKEITLEELDSKTYKNAERNLMSMIESNGRDSMYLTVPDFGRVLNKHVASFKQIYDALKKGLIENHGINLLERDDFDYFSDFRKENESAVNYMVKEFNLRKNARGRRKVKESKTGDLNPTKLYSYKFNDDIFRRAATVANEKNHALVFYIDWSGSMTSLMRNTIKQLLCLVMFCRKQKIPYEVYAFTSNGLLEKNRNSDEWFNYESKPLNEIHIQHLELMNILSYKMTNTQFITAANFLLSFNGYGMAPKHGKYTAYYISHNGYSIPQWFVLGNTPLNHCILFSHDLAEKLKNETNTDVVNNIFLTDGDSHYVNFVHENRWNQKDTECISTCAYNNNIYLRSFDKKHELRVTGPVNDRAETKWLTEFTKQRNDFRYFGFRILRKGDIIGFAGQTDLPFESWASLQNAGFAKLKDSGFDAFYLVPDSCTKLATSEFEVKEGERANAIFKKFETAIRGKFYNKIFLQKFIEFIS